MTRLSLIGNFIRGPRGVLFIFLALTILPAAALVWLGVNQLERDQAKERTRILEQRKNSAGQIITELQQTINGELLELGNPDRQSQMAAGGSHIVRMNSGHFEISPETELPFYPVVPDLPAGSEELFESGEYYEFQLHDYDTAIEKFRELSSSADAAVRAAARIRIARILTRNGRPVEALDVYADLLDETHIAIAPSRTFPVDLLSRIKRCEILASLHRTEELRQEAGQLESQLIGGHRKLDRDTYVHLSNDISGWLDRPAPPTSEAEILASAVDRIFKNNRDEYFSDHQIAAIWSDTPEGRVGLIAGRKEIENWLSRMDDLLQRQGARITLFDTNDQLAFGEPASPDSIPQSVPGLPWTIAISSANSESDTAALKQRGHLWIWGMVLMGGAVSAGGYFVARSIARELETARLQSDFVSSVSHEFRTPLTSLRQVTEILNDDRVADPSWIRDYHQTQARATDRLQRLVESLLDFGRMEAGTKPYRLRRCDASELIASVVSEFQTSTGENAYSIEYRPDGRPLWIDADPEACTQALWNLLDNAVKYSPESRKVWVELSAIGNHVAIAVRDQGMGIPDAEQKVIFRRFVRGAASRTNGIKGTGVGLAVVQHIVHAHDGEIKLHSEPGKGSTFTIVLPQSRS